MRAEEALHAQARKCQRLASESLDPFVREALIELASHYEHQADRLEQQRQETGTILVGAQRRPSRGVGLALAPERKP